MGRDVAHFVKVAWAHLTDVKVDHVAIVSVDLCQLVISKVGSVEPVLDVHVLMRKSDGRVTMVVARGLLVVDANILGGLVFINLEVEVRLGLDLRVDFTSETVLFLLSKLLLEVESIELLLNEGADATLNLLEVRVVLVVYLSNTSEDTLLLLGAAELSEPFGLSSLLLLLLLEVNARVALKVLELVVESGLHILDLLSRLSSLVS